MRENAKLEKKGNLSDNEQCGKRVNKCKTVENKAKECVSSKYQSTVSQEGEIAIFRGEGFYLGMPTVSEPKT